MWSLGINSQECTLISPKQSIFGHIPRDHTSHTLPIFICDVAKDRMMAFLSFNFFIFPIVISKYALIEIINAQHNETQITHIQKHITTKSSHVGTVVEY